MLSPTEGITESECNHEIRQVAGILAGLMWLGGWLYTITYTNLAWWKITLGIVSWVVWPYFKFLVLR